MQYSLPFLRRAEAFSSGSLSRGGRLWQLTSQGSPPGPRASPCRPAAHTASPHSPSSSATPPYSLPYSYPQSTAGTSSETAYPHHPSRMRSLCLPWWRAFRSLPVRRIRRPWAWLEPGSGLGSPGFHLLTGRFGRRRSGRRSGGIPGERRLQEGLGQKAFLRDNLCIEFDASETEL